MLKNPPKLKSERVFVGFNFAGSAGISSFTRVLKERGYKIDFYGFNRPNFNIPVDVVLKFSSNPMIALWERISYFFKILPQYDIWHFNYGKTFFFYPLNLLILKIWGKKIVCTFRGSDVRTGLDFLPNAEVLYDSRFNWPEWYKEFDRQSIWTKWQKQIRMLVFTWFSDQVVLTGPFLVGSVVAFDQIIPYGRDLEKITKYQKISQGESLTIFHAPTVESVKGTDTVKQVFETLAEKYPQHRFVIKTGLPHETLLKEMGKADIIIDQLLVGWYGGQAVEAMALGKPVLSFIYPLYLGLVEFGLEIPVVNTNYWNLTQDLENLINSPELRQDLGEKGLAFVQKYHSAEKIADEYSRVYEKALVD